MMKKIYEEPEFELIVFGSDTIVTSPGPDPDVQCTLPGEDE